MASVFWKGVKKRDCNSDETLLWCGSSLPCQFSWWFKHKGHGLDLNFFSETIPHQQTTHTHNPSWSPFLSSCSFVPPPANVPYHYSPQMGTVGRQRQRHGKGTNACRVDQWHNPLQPNWKGGGITREDVSMRRDGLSITPLPIPVLITHTPHPHSHL